jgi:hypothetical protein
MWPWFQYVLNGKIICEWHQMAVNEGFQQRSMVDLPSNFGGIQ